MKWRKATKNEVEKLKAAMDELNAMRDRYSKTDAAGFVGAIIITYNALMEGYRRAGELGEWAALEAQLMGAVTLEYPNLPRPAYETPYK